MTARRVLIEGTQLNVPAQTRSAFTLATPLTP